MGANIFGFQKVANAMISKELFNKYIYIYMSKYVDDVIKRVEEKNKSEPEFIQAVKKFTQVYIVYLINTQFKKVNLLERFAK